jgi:hypothetical protein
MVTRTLQQHWMLAPDDGAGSGTTDADSAADNTGPDEAGEETTEDAATADSVEKWKSLSRKNERALRAAQRELEELRRSQLSETDKALDDARREARDAALAEVRADLLDAAVDAAVRGRFVDDEAAAALLTRTGSDQYLTDDGKVDRAAVDAAVEELLVRKPDLAATARRTAPALPGARGRTGDSGESANDWLRRMAGRG